MIKTIKRKKIYSFSLIVFAVLFLISVFSKTDLFQKRAEAASDLVAPLDVGDVSGFAWMGTGIVNPNASEGGGGWLNFNCKETYCADGNNNGTIDASEQWGVTMNTAHSSAGGTLQGSAWSSNYGWLQFRSSDVSRCWTSYPGVTTNGFAQADIESGGAVVPVTGWAKFIAGDDDLNDGWDGCVAFSGANHSVQLDMNTGSLKGWAWGGPVVGWISFQNPECPQCNTSVNLGGTPQMTFWVNPGFLLPGMTSANIKWTSSTVNGNYIDKCTVYDNTSNYPHWDSALPNTAPNVVAISVAAGNLPAGLHPATGITQTTTYSLSCNDRFGVTLPTKYATVVVTPTTITACTDPLANNDIPTGPNVITDNSLCTYDNPTTVDLSLNAAPQTIDINGPYDVNLNWASNATGEFSGTCTGTAKLNASNITVPLWSTSSLPLPNNDRDVNLSAWASGLSVGDQFTFKISCNSTQGVKTDSAVVNVIRNTIPVEPPVVQLWIKDPISNNFQASTEIPPWNPGTASGGWNPVTFKWQELNVVSDSCVSSSVMYNSSGTPIGSNNDWNGQPLPVEDIIINGGFRDLDITAQSVINRTMFRISCHPLDDPNTGADESTTWISSQVCMGVSGQTFPQCSSGTALNKPPSYKEI